MAKPAVPSEYTCRCGSRVMSETDVMPLTRRDRDTKRVVPHLCSCGGAFQLKGPLQVVPIVSLPKIQITCKKCRVPYRKVTPHRFSCTSCSDAALVHEKSLWLFPSAQVSIDYAKGA